MSKKIKVGIVGFGLAGRDMHYAGLKKGLSEIVDIVAVYNRSKINRNTGFPVDNHIMIYNDYQLFLNHPGMEVVHITTSSGSHKEFICEAARNGKHVICDKPIEVTLKRIDDSIAECRNNNVVLSVSFQHRYADHLLKLKQVLNNGLLGDIVSGSVEAKLYRNNDYYMKSSWHGTLDGDGGAALMNQGIHYVDLIQWLIGSPVVEITKGIAERLIHTGIEGEDFGYGEVLFKNNAKISILSGTCFRPGIDQRIELLGTKGWVQVINSNVRMVCWDGKNQIEQFNQTTGPEQSSSSPAVELENHIKYFKSFYSALREGKNIPVPGEEARKSVEIVLGIYKAHETKAKVKIPYNIDYKPELKE